MADSRESMELTPRRISASVPGWPGRAPPGRGAVRPAFRLFLALIALQHLDDLLTDPAQVRAELVQHLRGDALTLAHQPQEEVLGPDVVVAKLQGLAQRQLQHLPGPRRKPALPGWRRLGGADDLLDLLADSFQADSQGLQRLRRDTLALLDESEQEVLGADAAVMALGFFLSQGHRPPRPVGKPLKHGPPRPSMPRPELR